MVIKEDKAVLTKSTVMSFLSQHVKLKLSVVKGHILGSERLSWMRGYGTPLGTTLVITGLGWLLYEVYATYNTLRTIGKVDIMIRRAKYIHLEEKITQGLVLDGEGYLRSRGLRDWAQRTRYRLAARLLDLARGEDQGIRREGVRRLGTLRGLSTSDLWQLAQACDQNTALGLARTPKTNRGLFLPPPKVTKERDELVSEMKHLLYSLNQESDHACIKYFLSKVFPENDSEHNYFMDGELTITEPWLTMTSDHQLLAVCVQALDHHISITNSEDLLVTQGGLSTLMAVYQLFQTNNDVVKSVCRILARVSCHKCFLPQMHQSGWLGVLSSLLDSKDEQVSVLAGQCLASLDDDDPCQARYGRHTILLHPLHRAHAPTVDVVFVHGLLGGIFTTWRQRTREEPVLFTLTPNEESPADSLGQSSDTHTKDYLNTLSELTTQEWEQLGSDYEFVADDFPLACKPDCVSKPLTFPGSDPRVRRHDHHTSFTSCWPKDWLPADCPSIRVLGIEYDSRLSEWFPSCSEKKRVKTLEERSATVLEELKRSEIGRRPVVWVAHSMGGLLVKKILTDSMSSQDRLIADNTKAVVFLSTPHLGCPLAQLNDFLNYLLWPSKEVEELRLNTDLLNDLQLQFLNYLKATDVKIVTFTEAKSTKITSLGVDLHVVPPQFSHFDVGELYEMPCDHACVAKPYSRLSFIYDTVLSIIKHVKHQQSA